MLQWSQSIFMFIYGRGKYGHLFREIVAPEVTNPKHRAWKTDDHLVLSPLISSMTTEVGDNFLLFKMEKDIWEAAHDMYSSTENCSALFDIETRLYDLRQGEFSVTQYFNFLTSSSPRPCRRASTKVKQNQHCLPTMSFLTMEPLEIKHSATKPANSYCNKDEEEYLKC
ncbi:hypothetical protein C2S51_037476 [Perilla frutescens var. frutescens]|nr:hypothetical protein C2S51_037476 [Perilla frutescens var. frutescens]